MRRWAAVLVMGAVVVLMAVNVLAYLILTATQDVIQDDF